MLGGIHEEGIQGDEPCTLGGTQGRRVTYMILLRGRVMELEGHKQGEMRSLGSPCSSLLGISTMKHGLAIEVLIEYTVMLNDSPSLLLTLFPYSAPILAASLCPWSAPSNKP
jgi:hypothetical protein